MKAKRKSDGKIIEVREWRGVSDVVYSTLDMNEFYEASDLDFLPEKETAVLEGWLTRSKSGELVLSDSPECKRGGCVWYHKEGSNVISVSELGLFSNDIFPSVTWLTEPKKVRITLEAIEE